MSASDGAGPARGGRIGTGDDDARVRVAQVELLRDHLPSILAGTFAGAVLVVGFVAWASAHDAAAFAWLGAMALVTLARGVYTVRLHRVATHAGNVEARIRWLTALIGLNAALWAALGWYGAGSGDPMITLVIVMVLVGLVASGVGFISHLRTMFLIYAGTMMLPMAVRFALDDSDGLRWIGALVVLFVGISVQTSRVTARAVLHSLRLRFENLALVERLGGEIRRADAARTEAEAASRAKSVFLGAASHDLRQPLHSLRLLSTTLDARVSRPRAPDDDGETERVLVRRMDESVRALEALFDSILDVSRLDAGTLEANVEHVRLGTVLGRVRRDFAPLAHLRGLEFSVCETAAVVRTDPVLLERLLGNLVANALRYTPRGSVRITVGGDAGEGPSARVHLAVVDTGVGIAAADQERVFEEFVQLGNPERDRSRGIGLGLSIVRRLAALLDIDVRLDSRTERGTRFVLALEPGEPARVAPVPARPVARTRRCAGAGLDGLFVLVIDDERDVRHATCAMLESWSCRCLAAGSAAEAIEALAPGARDPDVIVSDYRLRGEHNGTAAIAAVRARIGAPVPALLVTGDVAAERLADMRESGLPVLHKPCAPEALAALLRELTAGRGQEDGLGA